jgi:hypothetical protein
MLYLFVIVEKSKATPSPSATPRGVTFNPNTNKEVEDDLLSP